MAFAGHDSKACFVSIPNDEVPSNATVWTNKQCCVSTNWLSIKNYQNVELKVTTFEDGRLRVLEPVNDTKAPEEFANCVSGQYDIKTWRNENFLLSIDGEVSVLMKFPNVDSVISYTSPTRLPTFSKSWKPIFYVVSKSVFMVRLTEECVLILTRENPTSSTLVIHAVNYVDGFICVDPIQDLILSYGSYSVKSLKNFMSITPICPKTNAWGHLVQFYTWGGLILPKFLRYTKSGVMTGLNEILRNKCKFGLLFHPPNIFLHLIFSLPGGISCNLKHGEDYAVTAKKPSDCDIVIYLLINGQLIQYNYSFDIRINKPNNPRVNHKLKFKITVDKHEKKNSIDNSGKLRWNFVENKNLKVLIKSGSPNNDFQYLISEEVVAVYDATTGYYMTHPQGAKNCSLFKRVLLDKRNTTTCPNSPTTNAKMLMPPKRNAVDVKQSDTSCT